MKSQFICSVMALLLSFLFIGTVYSQDWQSLPGTPPDSVTSGVTIGQDSIILFRSEVESDTLAVFFDGTNETYTVVNGLEEGDIIDGAFWRNGVLMVHGNFSRTNPSGGFLHYPFGMLSEDFSQFSLYASIRFTGVYAADTARVEAVGVNLSGNLLIWGRNLDVIDAGLGNTNIGEGLAYIEVFTPDFASVTALSTVSVTHSPVNSGDPQEQAVVNTIVWDETYSRWLLFGNFTKVGSETTADAFRLSSDGAFTPTKILGASNSPKEYLKGLVGDGYIGSSEQGLMKFNGEALEPLSATWPINLEDITKSGDSIYVAGALRESDPTMFSRLAVYNIVNGEWSDKQGDLINQDSLYSLNITLKSFFSVGSNIFVVIGNFTSASSPYGEGLAQTYLDPNPSLPVELVDFAGHRNQNLVDLWWSTATELNNDYFVIQSSSDGRTFGDIGKVKGSGTTQFPQYYQFTDSVPYPVVTYYRLKQVDFDGEFEYSDIIAIQTFAEDLSSGAVVFPNPTTSLTGFSLRFDAKKKGSTTLRVHDISGKVLISKNVSFSEGSNLTEAETTDLAPGSYLVKMSVPSGGVSQEITRRLILVK